MYYALRVVCKYIYIYVEFIGLCIVMMNWVVAVGRILNDWFNIFLYDCRTVHIMRFAGVRYELYYTSKYKIY